MTFIAEPVVDVSFAEATVSGVVHVIGLRGRKERWSQRRPQSSWVFHKVALHGLCPSTASWLTFPAHGRYFAPEDENLYILTARLFLSRSAMPGEFRTYKCLLSVV